MDIKEILYDFDSSQGMNAKLFRNREYVGQPHTDSGERGKTEVKGITMRDIVDCFVLGCFDASSHLLNTIRFLERIVHQQEYEMAFFLENMFERAFEEDLVRQLDDEWHECDMPPIYKHLVAEAKRRKLTEASDVSKG